MLWDETEPYIWLQDDEAKGVSDDGNVVLRASHGDSGPAVWVSPLLQAAPKLLKAAETAVSYLFGVAQRDEDARAARIVLEEAIAEGRDQWGLTW